jgi:Tol biopolymer transport system component
MTFIQNLTQLILFFAAWLLPLILLLGLLGLFWRQRRAGQIALLLAGLLLLLIGVAYAAGDVSWRLFPALVNGYHYDPNEMPPDPLLVPRRPELLIERQLTALIGQTGPAPLRENSPLASFTIDAVHIDNWRQSQWLTAVLDTTLTFADGRQEQVALTLPARGGYNLLVPFLGEVNRNAYAWYAPESSLGHLLQMPAPATPLRDDAPPLTLSLVERVKASGLAGVNPDTSFLSVADVSADGRLLLDVDLRQGETAVGNALLYYANGQIERLAETFISTRAHFAPDGRRLVYIRSQRNHTLQLVVREADGTERPSAPVDWMTHHWVGNGQIAYSYKGGAYLYNLNDDESQLLVNLPPHEFRGGSQFRVAPDGERIAYVDFNGRLWIKELAGGQTQPIGWDVNNAGWNPGLAWREDGQQLLFVTRDSVTRPNHLSLGLWDAASGETRLLAQAGPGFLGQTATSTVDLGAPCWLDDETAAIAAYIPGYTGQLHILTVKSDGSGLWDVTPENGPFPYPELHCGNGYLAISADRAVVELYRVNQ